MGYHVLMCAFTDATKLQLLHSSFWNNCKLFSNTECPGMLYLNIYDVVSVVCS